MMKTLNIVQGEQYAIPFPLFVSGVRATPDNVTGVRIQLDDELKAWPDGGLSYDAQRGVWCYPITEALTRSWEQGKKLPVQVGLRVGGSDIHYTPTFSFEICGNIIKEAWTE